ncbi:hypothetical protein [Actinomadura sp. 6N118]|uniref:hypothetical protein n=1 Tax=Actinomadura sp. 6N118 TaxID=3375151 RepID=UPI0037972744
MSDNGHLTQTMANMVKSSLAPKQFSTGSKGFFATGKVEVGGRRYQAQVQAVLIGSKNDPKAKVRASLDEAQAPLLTTSRPAPLWPVKPAKPGPITSF